MFSILLYIYRNLFSCDSDKSKKFNIKSLKSHDKLYEL